MKKLVVAFSLLIAFLSLTACKQRESFVPDVLPYVPPATMPPATVPPESQLFIDTDYYTLSAPESWREDCFYNIAHGESYNYSVMFYEKSSYNANVGGWLFSILLLPTTVDYSIYPFYDVLGSLEVFRIGSYNIVVTYPTDVQFTDEAANKYSQMSSEIPEILKSISFKDECTFQEEPLPIDDGSSSHPSLSAEFYDELYSYTVSSCVNDTQWWNDPTLSFESRAYYLGVITAENYSEKMTQAKELVDRIYKTEYWEIRYNGYGVIKIGLYVSPADGLYLCYE